MRYKQYNIATPEMKKQWQSLLNAVDVEAIRKKMHYTKKMKPENIRLAIKAGATPNKYLFDAIVRYYEGKGEGK